MEGSSLGNRSGKDVVLKIPSHSLFGKSDLVNSSVSADIRVGDGLSVSRPTRIIGFSGQLASNPAAASGLTADAPLAVSDVEQIQSSVVGLSAAAVSHALQGMSHMQSGMEVSISSPNIGTIDSHMDGPPQVFNAPLNGANLLSSGSGSLQDTESDPIDINSTDASVNISQNLGLAGRLQMQSMPSIVHVSSGSLVQAGNHQFVELSTSHLASTGHLMSLAASSQSRNGHHSQQHQQPTYVLLHAPMDGDSSGQPQVFLAMQTGSLNGQDPQMPSYITLHPVSVEGNDVTMGLSSADGMGIQRGVLTAEISNDLGNDAVKAISQLSGDRGQQVILNIPTQQALDSPSSLVTYLQPVGSVGGVGSINQGQGQIIIAASDVQALSGRQSSGQSAVLAGVGQVRRRLSTDPRSCEECGRTFKYPSDLKKHLQIHTDVKKFSCDECNRTFRRLHQLNVHRRIHTGEKPYICNRCGAQFRHDSTLTMHVRTRHDHLKPFSCEGCGKKFGRMSHLRKHQRNVCGRVSVRGAVSMCKYCEIPFNKKSDLKSHSIECEKKPDRIDKEIMVPMFICETCGKEFTRLYDFKRHQLSHSDEKPYLCPQCGKSFKERSSLNKHVRRMHCSDGDGTIPIDDEDIACNEEDEEDEGDDDDDDDDEDLSSDERDLNVEEDVLITATMTSKLKSDPDAVTVTAQALAQAGIIASADGRIMTADGRAISASDILNFPEVAAALGLTSSTAVVTSADGRSSLISISNPTNLETSEVSMDMDQNLVQDSGICDGDTPSGSAEEPFDPAISLELHANLSASATVPSLKYRPSPACGGGVYDPQPNAAVGVVYVSASVLHGVVPAFKLEDPSDTLADREQALADHAQAEEAAAHDLISDDSQLVISVSEEHHGEITLPAAESS